MAEGWAQTGLIPSIERDLALEKLRRLYEELSGGAPAAPAAADAVSVSAEEPVSINLDEVLSVELQVSEEPEALPVAAAGQDDGTVASDNPEAERKETSPEAVSESARPVVSGSEARTEAEASGPILGPTSGPAHEPTGRAGSGPESEAPGGVTPAMDSGEASEPAHGPEERQVPDSASAPETGSASGAEAIPLPDGKPAPEPRPAPQHQPSTTQSAKPEAASQSVIPSLFGPEDPEALRRHRQKQRILMSLYDMPEPEPRKNQGPSGGLRAQSGGGADYPALRAEVCRPVSDVSGCTAAEPREEASHPNGVRNDPDTRPFGHSSEGAEAEARPESAAVAAAAEKIEVLSVAGGNPNPETQSSGGASSAGCPAAEGVQEALRQETPKAPGAGAAAPESAAARSDDAPKGAVLGDVINREVRTLGDELSAPARGRTSEIGFREPVTDLRKAIGINDRFLLIRDLFGGDAEAFETAIAALNAFGDLDDCLIYIAEHYAWNPNSDGAKLLMELIERKLS